MTSDRARIAAVGLLGTSSAMALLGTWLGLRVTNTTLPEGTETAGQPVLLWTALVFVAVGSLIGARRPANLVGWMLIAIGVSWQVDHLAGSARIFLDVVRPELGGAEFAAWVFDGLWVLPVCALPLLVLLIPTGGLPSPRWRPAVWVLAGAALLLFISVGLRPGQLTSTPSVDNPFGVGVIGPWVPLFEGIGTLALVAATGAALASLVVRYRSGGPITRQQLKWVILSFVVVVLAQFAANVLETFGADPRTLGQVRTLPLVLIPLTCGIAILRHRLFDIDVVISRLVVYGALATGIVVLYVAVVVGVGRLVGAGDEPDLALAVTATALAAMAFDPARRGLQKMSNRAVYGTRATPYETLAAMSRRVGSWHEPTELLDRMAQAIADATGGRGEVWVASSTGLTRVAAWPLSTTDDSSEPAGTDHRTGPSGMQRRGNDAEAVFAVHHGGLELGALTVSKPKGERLSASEHRLLDDLAGSAAFVLENARLVDEVRASRQRLVAAQDTERRRVERDLHDGAQQRLLELALTLRRAEREIGEGAAGEIVAAALHQLQQALSELRDLARGIHPAVLTQQGLTAALESLGARSAVAVELDLSVDGRLAAPLESTAYFVASEALTNVTKHAGDEVSVRLSARRCGDGMLRIEVSDDGIGGADRHGAGLQGLADRVAALDGRFEVRSPLGSGTQITAVLPCG
jgi:signal transduction histidine kinase